MHQVGQQAARVVHADNDPMVIAHSTLTTGPGVAVIGADLRDPAAPSWATPIPGAV